MTITAAIVLFAIIWFMVLFICLPLKVKTQGDSGEVVPGTPESAPENGDIKNKLLLGIDEVVEPSIELAIRALKGELKVDETCIMHSLKLVVRMIFICTAKPQTE